MSSHDAKLTASDQELIDSARSGDTSAYAELWRRHCRSAARVARQFTSSIDADDLVSEAYARIFQRVLAGGGPTGAFRPYLYTTIRNLASSWGAASKDVQVDVIDEFEDDRIPDDPAAWALDRTLTAKAFRALPDRWQTVLWYTEVEGMDPHEVAPLMGLTANGVAALSYRAREGLRTAWLQAHISNDGASADCRWTISRLGDRARNRLTARERHRVELHLLECTKCSVISEEVEDVGSHLAMIMLPLLLGGVAGGALLAALAHPTAAMAAEVIPALPAAVEAVAAPATAHSIAVGSAMSAPILGGIALGASTGSMVLASSIAIIAMLGGGLALGAPASGTAPTHTDSSQHASASRSIATNAEETATASAVAAPKTIGENHTSDSVNHVLGAIASTTAGITAGVTVPPLTSDSTAAPATATTVELQLAGIGTPGATVTASVAGATHTTVVASNGSWAITVSGLSPSISGADASISQTTGLLNSVLSPLSLTLNSLGLNVNLLN